jgi:hypothetical protein
MRLVKLKKVDIKQPKNETSTHYLLKEVGKYVLYNMGYHILASEIYGMYGFDLRMKKDIIDAAGIKKKNIGRSSNWTTNYQWSMCGMEAKASLNDFRHGFCSAPALTYIITTKGTIPLEEIPDKIGLIEVDFDKLVINQYMMSKSRIEGVNIVKRARTRIDSRFASKEQYYNWCKNKMESIAYRSTIESLFWRNIISLKKGGA